MHIGLIELGCLIWSAQAASVVTSLIFPQSVSTLRLLPFYPVPHIKTLECNKSCVCEREHVLLVLWGHTSVYTLTSRGLVFHLGDKKGPHVNYCIFGLGIGLRIRVILKLSK